LIAKIHSTMIAVSDQDKALDFYVNTLGFEKAMDSPMGPDMRWLTVVPPGATTQLVLADPRMADPIVPGRSTGITLTTPDIDTAYATYTGRGVNFKGPVEEMPWGQKAAWFSDLDGNEFFLVEEA
jgi:catechol 2,3-dioxygenase-like lactoylglutathione lyase family enzyme